jgi:hypothetical protein
MNIGKDVLEPLQPELNRLFTDSDVVAHNEKLSLDQFVDLFKHGRDQFNSNKTHEAHVVWEMIWKECDTYCRQYIKGFIQLSGAKWNYKLGKYSAAKYLMEKAAYNIENSTCILKEVDNIAIASKINRELMTFYCTGDFLLIEELKI